MAEASQYKENSILPLFFSIGNTKPVIDQWLATKTFDAGHVPDEVMMSIPSWSISNIEMLHIFLI